MESPGGAQGQKSRVWNSAQARLPSPRYPQAAFSLGLLILPYKENPVSEQYVCASLVEVALAQLTIHF